MALSFLLAAFPPSHQAGSLHFAPLSISKTIHLSLSPGSNAYHQECEEAGLSSASARRVL